MNYKRKRRVYELEWSYSEKKKKLKNPLKKTVLRIFVFFVLVHDYGIDYFPFLSTIIRCCSR